MLVEIPDDNSIIKWKMNDKDDWKSAEIIDLINAYEERPHGEWVHISDSANRQRVIYKCSVCGRVIDAYYRENLTFSYPFCHCGAKMKGGAECG